MGGGSVGGSETFCERIRGAGRGLLLGFYQHRPRAPRVPAAASPGTGNQPAEATGNQPAEATSVCLLPTEGGSLTGYEISDMPHPPSLSQSPSFA